MNNNSKKRYGENSSTPNWPKPEYLKVKHFSKYCEAVNMAIIGWLILKWENELKEKFCGPNKWEITEEELNIIKQAYSLQVDKIMMLSGY